jgi:hypothetical protein
MARPFFRAILQSAGAGGFHEDHPVLPIPCTAPPGPVTPVSVGDGVVSTSFFPAGTAVSLPAGPRGYALINS